MNDRSGGVQSRDVIGVIHELRNALRAVPSDRCPEVAAEYLCDGSMAAVNLMDYGRSRYHTIANVGDLVAGEKRAPLRSTTPLPTFRTPRSTWWVGRPTDRRSVTRRVRRSTARCSRRSANRMPWCPYSTERKLAWRVLGGSERRAALPRCRGRPGGGLWCHARALLPGAVAGSQLTGHLRVFTEGEALLACLAPHGRHCSTRSGCALRPVG